METIQNVSDSTSGKLFLSPDLLARFRLALDQHAVVAFANGSRVLARVCSSCSSFSASLSVDRAVWLTPVDLSASPVLAVEPVPDSSVSEASLVELSLVPLDTPPPPFLHRLAPLLRLALLHRVVACSATIPLPMLGVTACVTRVEPGSSAFARVTAQTRVVARARAAAPTAVLGGGAFLDALCAACNADPPRGVLLVGERGSGKTALALHCAGLSRLPAVLLRAERVLGGFELLLQRDIREPHLVVIDDADVLHDAAPYELLQALAFYRRTSAVLCTATRPLPASCTGPALLATTATIPAPDARARQAVVEALPGVPAGVPAPLARRTAGYQAKDLLALHNEAAARRPGALRALADYVAAMAFVPPSLLAGSETDFDRLRWEDIGGLEDVKRRLAEAIEWPTSHRADFARLGIRPAHGVLLHGPSGCAKTSLVRAAATMLGTSFVTLTSATIYSPYVGDAEAAVRAAFRRARQAAPCIVFIDEIDTVVGERGGAGGDSVKDRVLSTLLNEMDGIEESAGVVLVAASNRKDLIDPALLRPGRFDCHIEVPLPDDETRRRIFEVALRGIPLDKAVDVAELAGRTAGRSGAEIRWIVAEACTATLREDIDARQLKTAHLLEVLQRSAQGETEQPIG